MNVSRIPAYDRKNPDGMLIWFSEMSRRQLLFHPEESPSDILNPASGTPLFTDAECMDIGRIVNDMFSEFGDGVIETCYPIFMKSAGQMVALDS